MPPDSAGHCYDMMLLVSVLSAAEGRTRPNGGKVDQTADASSGTERACPWKKDARSRSSGLETTVRCARPRLQHYERRDREGRQAGVGTAGLVTRERVEDKSA